MNNKKIADSLHSLERKVLPHLKEWKDIHELISVTGLKEIEVNRALQWLKNKGLIEISEAKEEVIKSGKNGRDYLKNGLPERTFLNAVGLKTTTLKDIEKKTKLNKNEISVSIGVLRKKNIIYAIKKKELEISLTDNGRKYLTTDLPEERSLKKLPIKLNQLSDDEKKTMNELKRRNKIINVEVIKLKKARLTEKGSEVLKVGFEENIINKLTPEVLLSKEWKKKRFRRYDVNAQVPLIYPGRRHFVNNAINYVRKIWTEMGFKEMNNSIVQTAFWDFDALFTPQDHPAREMQDTFFLDKLGPGDLPKRTIVEAVKKTHENGGNTGSMGWKYKWNVDKARQLVLRTHTTVVSARKLSERYGNSEPAKFFSIGRVYRNETLDWSHLSEFNQTEGIVIGDVNFRHLIGYLKEFFKKMNYDKIRLRPAYFPYTEMSVEVEVFDKTHDSWLELGGAGMFRPEVVKTLIGEDVQVLAWGLGLARIIKNYYNLEDIRSIYKNNIGELRTKKEWLL